MMNGPLFIGKICGLFWLPSPKSLYTKRNVSTYQLASMCTGIDEGREGELKILLGKWMKAAPDKDRAVQTGREASILVLGMVSEVTHFPLHWLNYIVYSIVSWLSLFKKVWLRPIKLIFDLLMNHDTQIEKHGYCVTKTWQQNWVGIQLYQFLVLWPWASHLHFFKPQYSHLENGDNNP